MTDRVDKASVLNPRRSSYRAAKTTAMSALTTRSTSTSKAKIVLATAEASITPLHDIRKKLPPKKQWKARGQLLLSAAAAKVTPHRDTVSPHIIVPLSIKSTKTKKKKKKSEEPPVLLRLREQASPEPLILATLNVDGGFEDSASKGSGDFDRDASSIRKLRSVKVTTYCHQGYNSFSNEAFPVKLYCMVQFATLEYPQACRWSQDGRHVEVAAKNPVLLSIIRRYFKHSKWLSFTRQLNNYGFNCAFTKKKEKDGNKNRNHEIKSYHHPQFHRGIEDPIGLTKLLPYLPNLRKREKMNKLTAAIGTKRTKLVAAAATATKSSQPTNRDAANARIAKESKTMIRHQGGERSTSQGKDIAALVDFFETPSPQYRKPKAKTGTKRPKPAAVVAATSNRGDEANTKTAKKSKTMVQRHKGHKGGERSTSQGKDIATLVDSFKTPSPRYRKPKAKYMSSPPPLSHYLQPKNKAPYRQPFPDPHGHEQDTADGPTTTLASSVIESPLPSSLLTVNFVMTPSPPPNDEPTPQTHNLSSSLVAASSLQHSGAVVNVNVNVNPSSPDDGVRMLSWAAHAVESPAFREDDEDHQKTSTPRTTPNGETTLTRVKFTEAIGCSPIIHTTKASERALVEAIRRCYSPTTAYSSSSSAASSYSPVTHHPAMYYNDGIGPSPFSFRDHHQETEIELELLRNCLEDVFVSGTSNGSTAIGGSAVSSHCGSATLTSEGTNEVLDK